MNGSIVGAELGNIDWESSSDKRLRISFLTHRMPVILTGAYTESPTGIMEILKQKANRKSSCFDCASRGHAYAAKYCFNCQNPE